MSRSAGSLLYGADKGMQDSFSCCEVPNFETTVKDDYVDQHNGLRLPCKEIYIQARVETHRHDDLNLWLSNCTITTLNYETFRELSGLD